MSTPPQPPLCCAAGKRGLCVKYDDGDVRYYHHLPDSICHIENSTGHHCPDCGKYYSSPERLETHRRSQHPQSQSVSVDSIVECNVYGGITNLLAVKELLKCAVCLNTMEDPVTVKECMHSFCQECIATCIRKKLKFCPTCKQSINSVRAMKANTTLRALVDVLGA